MGGITARGAVSMAVAMIVAIWAYNKFLGTVTVS
jgi:hypothetical protein